MQINVQETAEWNTFEVYTGSSSAIPKYSVINISKPHNGAQI